MISKITRVYTRHYSDTGQTTTYVERVDHRGQTGRTEGEPGNRHMLALVKRGKDTGIKHERETW